MKTAARFLLTDADGRSSILAAIGAILSAAKRAVVSRIASAVSPSAKSIEGVKVLLMAADITQTPADLRDPRAFMLGYWTSPA